MTPEFFGSFLQFGMRFSTVSGKLLRQCKPDSLTPLQYEMLRIIDADKEVTLSDLCNCAEIIMPNGSREMKKLSAMELVEKKNDSKDKRIQLISLSSKGEALVHGSYQTLMKIIGEQYKDLPQSDLEKMTQSFIALNQLL